MVATISQCSVTYPLCLAQTVASPSSFTIPMQNIAVETALALFEKYKQQNEKRRSQNVRNIELIERIHDGSLFVQRAVMNFQPSGQQARTARSSAPLTLRDQRAQCLTKTVNVVGKRSDRRHVRLNTAHASVMLEQLTKLGGTNAADTSQCLLQMNQEQTYELDRSRSIGSSCNIISNDHSHDKKLCITSMVFVMITGLRTFSFVLAITGMASHAVAVHVAHTTLKRFSYSYDSSIIQEQVML